MLLQQGAKAFELWTGKPAPVDVMQAELERVREQGLTQWSLISDRERRRAGVRR